MSNHFSEHCPWCLWWKVSVATMLHEMAIRRFLRQHPDSSLLTRWQKASVPHGSCHHATILHAVFTITSSSWMPNGSTRSGRTWKVFCSWGCTFSLGDGWSEKKKHFASSLQQRLSHRTRKFLLPPLNCVAFSKLWWLICTSCVQQQENIENGNDDVEITQMNILALHKVSQWHSSQDWKLMLNQCYC